MFSIFLVQERTDELAILETRNNGKPIWEAKFDIKGIAECLEYFGGLASGIVGELIHSRVMRIMRLRWS